MTVRHAIMVMAKAPFPGEAKTRLAVSLGDEMAARLHQAFLLDTLHRLAARGPFSLGIVCPDERHREALLAVVPGGVDVHVQERPGLMAGITAAVETALASGAQSVVVTEADSPSLPAGHVQACMMALELTQRGIVLGPCDDGGYYLVGARGIDGQVARDLFEGVTYVSESICHRTAERGHELGLAVHLGPEWYDVDTLQDLHRLAGELASQGDPLRHIQQVLAELDLPAASARSMAWGSGN